jgi:hypothetical protein
MLFEDDIALDIRAIGGYVYALVAFLHGTISEKDTLQRSVSEFGRVIRSEDWPTHTPENFELGICGLLVQKSFWRCG